MPPKASARTKPVNEQILIEAARIYDNRELRDEDDDVKMMKGTDLMSYAKFLSKDDAFSKVRTCALVHLHALSAFTASSTAPSVSNVYGGCACARACVGLRE